LIVLMSAPSAKIFTRSALGIAGCIAQIPQSPLRLSVSAMRRAKPCR
jgi:hypothetical protein